jgi:hypothetical protein
MRPFFAAWIAAVALALGAVGARAQASLEIIPLRHRTPEQVLPVLRPLLEPGGVLSAGSNQLIVRTSPRNLEQIESALAAIDTPLRRLLISVRFGNATEFAARDVEVRSALRPGGSGAELRAIDSGAAADERVDQRVQVLEGGRATIAVGQLRPLGAGTGEMQEIATGFTVVPRVAGQRVLLDIDSQNVATTVAAALGQWVEIGGVDSAGIVSESRRVWLKVEEIGP